jgi:hypothetical protein
MLSKPCDKSSESIFFRSAAMPETPLWCVALTTKRKVAWSIERDDDSQISVIKTLKVLLSQVCSR